MAEHYPEVVQEMLAYDPLIIHVCVWVECTIVFAGMHMTPIFDPMQQCRGKHEWSRVDLDLFDGESQSGFSLQLLQCIHTHFQDVCGDRQEEEAGRQSLTEGVCNRTESGASRYAYSHHILNVELGAFRCMFRYTGSLPAFPPLGTTISVLPIFNGSVILLLLWDLCGYKLTKALNLRGYCDGYIGIVQWHGIWAIFIIIRGPKWDSNFRYCIQFT